MDMRTDERWTLDLGNGRIPAWLFDAKRRVPATGVGDYLKLAPLIWAGTDARVGDTIACEGELYRRLVHPLLLAALNVDPPDGSAGLAGAIVRETLLAGGHACRPLIAREGLSAVLVDPALTLLRGRGAEIRLGHELRKVQGADGAVTVLEFGEDSATVAPGDVIVLAVPPRAAASILPGLTGPTRFRAIVNAHFRHDPPAHQPALMGIIGGLVEWLFAFPQRLSVTISDADRLVNAPREELARDIWRDICKAARLGAAVAEGPLPPWQIVRERRATFEATPEQHRLRPGPATAWTNLFLAGDWTDTGLPATIEGSIRSGDRAADLALKTT
jgi:squalene-associated FAD-dependent desaturase